MVASRGLEGGASVSSSVSLSSSLYFSAVQYEGKARPSSSQLLLLLLLLESSNLVSSEMLLAGVERNEETLGEGERRSEKE